jgi:hypothetical protein
VSVDITDLIPKPLKITIKGLEIEAKPLRLSHALTLAKVGTVFQDLEKASKPDLKAAEEELDEIIGELIPELAGHALDINVQMELIGKLMETITPSENKELNESKVSLPDDPKDQRRTG